MTKDVHRPRAMPLDGRRFRLRTLVLRLRSLRRQTLILAAVVVSADLAWILTYPTWRHHSTPTSIAECLSLVGVLVCAFLLLGHIRREQSETDAAIRRMLRR